MADRRVANAARLRRKQRKRDLLIWLYDGCCFWCDKPMVIAEGTRRNEAGDISIDELKPLSRGGFRVLPNQVPAHKLCNMQRGNVIAPQAAFDRHHAVLKAAGIEIEER